MVPLGIFGKLDKHKLLGKKHREGLVKVQEVQSLVALRWMDLLNYLQR